MEQILIGLFLGLFIERNHHHETPQIERFEESSPFLRYRQSLPSQELCGQPDARRNPAVNHAREYSNSAPSATQDTFCLQTYGPTSPAVP